MKLLGWMHRKFRQGSNEQLKDFVIGHACNCLSGQPMLDDQCNHQNLSCGSKVFKQGQADHHLRKSFAGLQAATGEAEEVPPAGASEPFHGFLAIGTLGSEPGFSDPATPTFPNYVENITDKDAEVTENELKMINDELEKVLVAEANEDWCNTSSGRNSHVSNGRSSHGSTITLSGKPMEGQESSARGSTNVCPLQEFLFGSAIELPETTAVAKKEHRTSLGELFQRSKTAEDCCAMKCEPEENQIEKEVDKSTVSLVKNKLKKKLLKGSNVTAGVKTDPNSEATTLHKILHMFHKKVHPENSNTAKKSVKRRKNGSKSKPVKSGSCNNSGNQLPPDQDIMMYPQGGDLPMEQSRRSRNQQKPSRLNSAESGPSGNRECWIKTDADYLVLEL
ncbi:protein LAZY 1-like isoform X2 [Punica granatum]|uniref:Protein LAZY 1-like isoform X2 n=1 Tax=Punica granatum TaxID=22663 RepID=A0A6P8D2Z6_PUNGR|nr:protein LAZY 1-like isoform X2 [Punica granatum]